MEPDKAPGDKSLDNSNADWDEGETVTDGSPTLDVTKGRVKVRGTLEVEDLQVNGTMTAVNVKTVDPVTEQPLLFDRLKPFLRSSDRRYGPYILVDPTPDDQGRLGYYEGFGQRKGLVDTQSMSRLWADTLTTENSVPPLAEDDDLAKIRQQYAGSIAEAKEEGYRKGFANGRQGEGMGWALTIGAGLALLICLAGVLMPKNKEKASETALQSTQKQYPNTPEPKGAAVEDVIYCPTCSQLAVVAELGEFRLIRWHLMKSTKDGMWVKCPGTYTRVK